MAHFLKIFFGPGVYILFPIIYNNMQILQLICIYNMLSYIGYIYTLACLKIFEYNIILLFCVNTIVIKFWYSHCLFKKYSTVQKCDSHNVQYKKENEKREEERKKMKWKKRMGVWAARFTKKGRMEKKEWMTDILDWKLEV